LKQQYFPFQDYWWFYVGFTAFVIILLLVDLLVFHRKAHAVKCKEALLWSAFWVSLALVFNYAFYQYAYWKFSNLSGFTDIESKALAGRLGLEFLTGFLIEKSLSVDNLFVFIAVFAFFGIPEKYQHRILFFGIISALFLRAIFIMIGTALMQYEWIVIIFGLLLIFTGVKMFFSPQEEIDPSKNILIKTLKRFLPITEKIEGQKFFVKENGILYGTPLFLTLVFIEISDLIFAVDSVPAIIALTDEPLIVFTSNVFAILGLRALFFLLASVYHKFHLLKFALGIVLIFVGLKMVWLNHLFGGKFPVAWSLTIISSLIGISIIASLVKPLKKGL
jgi:tellurite resistance protein TerC